MKLLLALLCRNADQNEDETLNAHCIFHVLQSNSFPVTPRPFALLCQFKAEKQHCGETLQVLVTLRDERGESVFEREKEIDVPREMWTPVISAFVAVGCEFARAGTYTFEIELDGEAAGKIELEVSRS